MPLSLCDCLFEAETRELCTSHWRKHLEAGPAYEAEWNESLASYEKEYPEEAAEFKQLISNELPTDWFEALPVSPLHSSLVVTFVRVFLQCAFSNPDGESRDMACS